MINQTEKLERWINAYLDGALEPSDAARFESVVQRNPSLRDRIQLHRKIEASLNRSFSPPSSAPDLNRPTATASIPIESARSAAPDPARARKSGGFLKGLAIAAMLAIVAYGGYWGWEHRSMFMGGSGSMTLAQFYDASATDDFKEGWACKSDREFQTTFWYRLGYGVALASPTPSNVNVKGLKYADTLSPTSIHLMAKVGDKGVIVFVDGKDKDRKEDVSTEGLKAFRKETEHLVFVEVTPLDRPLLLSLLSETELPEKWKAEPEIPMQNPN
ncbi:MAG: hypothetical protein KDA33_01405 [Phycisphaerales bacterium]|nr:hypothetical protein [Phycisphaerales bacterium]